jgi:hypothetical protein
VGTSISGGAPHIYGGDSKGGGNVIAGNNDYGIYMSTTYAPWVKDNNTIHNNSVAGIYISSSVGTFNRQIWWNDVVDNGVGISAQNPTSGVYFHAECNWWDDGNGPDDDSVGPPDYWDNDPGQDVSNYFHYRDETDNDPYWLQQHSNAATSCKK